MRRENVSQNNKNSVVSSRNIKMYRVWLKARVDLVAIVCVRACVHACVHMPICVFAMIAGLLLQLPRLQPSLLATLLA